MVEISIDVDDAKVKQALRDLKDDYTTTREYKVGSNVEYAVFWSSGPGICPPTRL